MTQHRAYVSPLCRRLWLCVLLGTCTTTLAATSLTLTPTNHLSVRGPIDAKAASTFVHDSQLHHATVKYVYIDSPGGSVSAGDRMVEELQRRNYTCLVDTAYSMAFVLVQACARRLVRPSGSLMQHQIALAGMGLHGELGKVKARLDSIERVRQRLDQMQAARLNLTEAAFVARTTNEWWLDARDALTHRCVDALAPSLQCSAALLRTRVARTETAILGLFATATVREYSACPLVTEPLAELATAAVPWTAAPVGHNDTAPGDDGPYHV